MMVVNNHPLKDRVFEKICLGSYPHFRKFASLEKQILAQEVLNNEVGMTCCKDDVL